MKLFDLLEQHHGLDPGTLSAVQQVESGGDSGAVSRKGARGNFQIMPATAKELGVDPNDPIEAAMGAAKYLSDNSRRFGGDRRLMLAAYNAGPGAVRKYGDVPPYRETQKYVDQAEAAIPKRMKLSDIGMKLSDLEPAGEANIQEEKRPSRYDPTEGMSGPELRMAGLGKAIVDTGRGIGQMARHVLPESLSNRLGLPTQADIDEAKRLDEPLMNTTSGQIGNIAGNVALSFVPGGALKAAGALSKAPALVKAGSALMNPQTIRQGVTLGALMSSIQPTASNENAATQVGIGALGGGVGAAIPSLVSRVIQPNTSPAVRKLIDAGITPTPGQILGGAAQRLEDAATSVPFVGDAIKGAQRRAVMDFNRAAINRALKPIGETLPESMPVGNEAIRYMGDKLSQAYDDLLPKLRIRIDDDFTKEIDGLRNLAQDLPEARTAQFEKYLENNVLNRFTKEGNMLGDTMKQVDEKLGKDIRRYANAQDPDQQIFGDALKETQAILRRLVERGNQEHAPRLAAINEGWANLVRVEKAASMLGAKEGVFSGANLRNAVKSSDARIRKRGFGRGEALMQDLADAGEKVLGQKVPDSGTPFRMGAMMPLGASYMFSPDLAFGALGAAGAYSPQGVSLARLLLSSRPTGAASLADAVRRATPYLSRAGALIPLAISHHRHVIDGPK